MSCGKIVKPNQPNQPNVYGLRSIGCVETKREIDFHRPTNLRAAYVMSSPNEGKIIGLKQAIKKHSGLKNFFKRELGEALQFALDLTIKYKDDGEAFRLAAEFGLRVKCSSSNFNVKSNIKPYTNKQGRQHQAHFTYNGTYLGAASKLGAEPIFYDGKFPVCTDLFTFEPIPEGDFDQVFIPRKGDFAAYFE